MHVEHSVPVQHYVNALQRWRFLIIAAFAVLVAGCGFGLSKLTLASNYEIYFDDSNPQLEALNALHHTFSRNDNILIAIEPLDGRVFTPGMLQLLGEITEAAWKLPYSSRVSSITNYQHVESSGDNVTIRDLIEHPAGLNAEQAAALGEVALRQRLLVGRLLSADATVTGVNVRLELGDRQNQNLQQAVLAARQLAAKVEAEHKQVRVYLTGNAMLNAAFPEASVHDLTYLTPFMYLLIALGIWLFLRSFRSALLAMAMVALASVVAMGIAGWMGIVVSSASVAAPTIVTTVVVAYSLHVLAGFLRLRSAQVNTQADAQDCVTQTLSVNLRPISVAALTTVVGFSSLNFSEAPPFRDLGNITCIGVVAAFAMSVALLPVLLMMLKPGGRRAPLVKLERFANWVIRWRTWTLSAVLVCAAGAAVVIPRLELNDAFVEYFDTRVPFRNDTDFVMSRLTGIYQVEYAMPSGMSDGVYNPQYIACVDAFEKWLRAQPEVVHVFSIAEIMKRLNVHLGDGRRRVPDSRELAAQYLLLYEMSVPYGLDLNDRIDVDRESSRVSVTLRNLDNVALRAFEARADRWMHDNMPAVMRAPAVGAAIMFAYIAERNIHAMLSGAALAVLLIAAVLAVVFRGVRLGLISLIPNIVPALLAIGIWTLAVGQMGVALAIVTTMTLGIVVDDTVHFATCFVQAIRRRKLSPEDAVRHAFATTGTALVSTSLVLVLGFGVLSLSAFEVNHGMGQLTALTIVCALVADFLMLPGLLIAAARRGWV